VRAGVAKKDLTPAVRVTPGRGVGGYWTTRKLPRMNGWMRQKYE
jgi:hypothetical protein